MESVPHRPAISNVLIKASANAAFRARLLTNPRDALADMTLPAEDVEVLTGVQAPNLKEYAHQVKIRLMVSRLCAKGGSMTKYCPHCRTVLIECYGEFRCWRCHEWIGQHQVEIDEQLGLHNDDGAGADRRPQYRVEMDEQMGLDNDVNPGKSGQGNQTA